MKILQLAQFKITRLIRSRECNVWHSRRSHLIGSPLVNKSSNNLAARVAKDWVLSAIREKKASFRGWFVSSLAAAAPHNSLRFSLACLHVFLVETAAITPQRRQKASALERVSRAHFNKRQPHNVASFHLAFSLSISCDSAGIWISRIEIKKTKNKENWKRVHILNPWQQLFAF